MLIKRKHVFIMIGVSSLVAACLFSAVREKGLRCQAMPVAGGYGYVILSGKDTLILQPYIPAVGSKQAFSTEEDAMKIGKLVCRKLQDGQSPAVDAQEIACSGVRFVSVP